MKNISLKFLLALLLGVAFASPNDACTIFVLTDARKTLFFNNEDYSNPVTRIWFLPAEKGYHGVAYVGFDNDWAQGGVNTAGLAFDWVAGFAEPYVPDQQLLRVRGNPSERMLESCATVEEAIAFYRKYREPSFSTARIMIADKTGASVIIGARNGQIHLDRSVQSRGFGYGQQALAELLKKDLKPTLENGLPILDASKQQGEFATKYSSVYDLQSGDIVIASSVNPQSSITLSLEKELAKGGHYHDMAQLPAQQSQPLLPLRPGMKRHLADGYTPIPDPDPLIDQRFRTIFADAAGGTLKADQFSEALWAQLGPNAKATQEEFKRMGKLQSFVLLERNETGHQRSYLYLADFEAVSILQRLVLDDKNRLAGLASEGTKQNPR
ncbi:hypothetical protein [Roseateles sp. P5_E1]